MPKKNKILKKIMLFQKDQNYKLFISSHIFIMKK